MLCPTQVRHLVSTVEGINLKNLSRDTGVEDLINERKNVLDATRKNYRNLPHPNKDPLKFLSKYFGSTPQQTKP